MTLIPIQSTLGRVRAYLIAELCSDALTPRRELADWYDDGLQLVETIALELYEGGEIFPPKKKDGQRKFRGFVNFDHGKRAWKFRRFRPRNGKPPLQRA